MTENKNATMYPFCQLVGSAHQRRTKEHITKFIYTKKNVAFGNYQIMTKKKRIEMEQKFRVGTKG